MAGLCVTYGGRGSGSDWSEEPADQGARPATQEQSRPWLSSRARSQSRLATVRGDDQLAVDGVADASLECAQCFFLALMLAEFAPVVDASRSVVAYLGDRGVCATRG